MKSVKNILMAAISIFALSSCVTNELVPDATTKVVSFAKKNINIPKTGDTQTIAVSANTDWTLRSDAEWVKLAPLFGTSATKSITVTVDSENNTEDFRVAQVFISSNLDSTQCDTLVVTQTNTDGVGKIVDAASFIAFLEAAPGLTDSDLVEIGEDIDFEGASLTPATSFAGTLEGNGHKLSNFVIESSFAGAGLIVENRGTIQNLKVGTKDGSTWDKTSVIKFAKDTEASSAGVVAINSGLISNVSNYASVDINVTSNGGSDAGVGGIAGVFGGPNAKLENCHNYGAVSFSGTLGYRSSLGGVLGFSAQGGTQVVGCVNHADITQSTKNAKEYAMGGVVGRANEKIIITDCTNEGAVAYTFAGAPGSYLHIGGIIGAEYKGSEITGCVNKGAISSCIAQVNRMGGIVGTMNTGGTITSCRNEAGLTLEQEANNNWQSVGGICGFEEKCTTSATGVIKDCVNNGKIKLVISNATTHANRTAAAGIIGITCSVTEITGNANNGEVSMTNTGSAETRAGGIVGWNKTTATTLEGNTNKGTVTVTAANGFAGGIAGAADHADSSVKENTNQGSVSGAVAGSIAGNADCTITSCAVGGSVNGVELTAGNFSSYIQGSGKGAPAGCYFPGASVKDYVTVSPVSVSVVAAGETKTLNVSANCAWTVSASEAWLSLSDAEGNGEGSVIVTAAENTTYSVRTATVTFTSKADASVSAVVNVSQAAKVDGLAGNKITSAADFKSFLVLAADAQASDTYTLETDVDYSSETLVPAVSFAGTLDGKGHKVTLKVETGEYEKLALIQTLTGTVKNLTVEGSIKNTFAGNKEYAVASVVATVDGGHVENCVNNATITDASTSTGAYANVGGVIAYLKGDGASISDCTNNGKITVSNKCQTIFGGVAAYGQTNSTAPTLSFKNLVNTADVEINHEGGNWDYIGGVIGKMGASSNPFALFTVSGCKYSGNMNIVKAPKIRGGGVFGSCGAASSYDVSNNEFSGKISITSTEAVDRLIGGVGPGYSEAGAIGKISNCVFNGVIEAVDGGNLYLGGIYGNNGSESVVIDGCKTTSKSAIRGFSSPKSVGMIAARPNKAGFTIKNCKIAGTVTSATGDTIVISASNIEEWMFKGSLTNVEVTLENNGFNAE